MDINKYGFPSKMILYNKGSRPRIIIFYFVPNEFHPTSAIYYVYNDSSYSEDWLTINKSELSNKQCFKWI